MKPLVVATAGETTWAKGLARQLDAERAKVEHRSFPDGETYLRIDSEIEGREVIITSCLDDPNHKVVPMLFAAQTARELGATRVGLVAPYLPYMRQDARFEAGEAVASRCFGRLVSPYFDWLVTVEPHLHRHGDLQETYALPTHISRVAEPLATWIEARVERPVLVGPDEESAQWVAPVAELGGFPMVILEKERRGDYDVEIYEVEAVEWSDRRPILIDDIISTGRTMLEAVSHLAEKQLPPPICIGIHGLFVEDALERLEGAPIAEVVTCNTIAHRTNEIDVISQVVDTIDGIWKEGD